MPASGSPAGLISALSVSRTGFGESGQQHRRADPGGVRDGVGVDGHPAAAGTPSSRRPGMYRGATTRGNRNVASPSWYGSGCASVRRVAVTRSPGAMLPTRIVEFVRPVLFGDRHLLSLRDRLVIVRPGLGTLLQHPLHDMPGGLHPHRGSRRPVRQREDVGRLQRDVERVTEALRHLHAGEQASNGGPHVNLFQRQVSPASCECTEAAVRSAAGSVSIGVM